MLRVGGLACAVVAILLWLWNWYEGSAIGVLSYLLVACTGGLLWASTLWDDED